MMEELSFGTRETIFILRTVLSDIEILVAASTCHAMIREFSQNVYLTNYNYDYIKWFGGNSDWPEIYLKEQLHLHIFIFLTGRFTKQDVYWSKTLSCINGS